ncbi:LISK family protein kinase [Cavenderia fasciculata]|uniref:non-specific serine/threonine protein kinase n=1 Tax=Cavenderia fasciculata TaxID=261658 RepID=F4Q642_CACFS|nr:LISK family protein kinase [Cavenderia fasciculata]EGG16628.1 LISK family protein kinase [Cavenderia fasciculata]|eukprot:XP_004355102.1 LISK family protein kinase [Cavenderia fasciculata]
MVTTTTTATTTTATNNIEGLPSNDVDLFNIDYSDLLILEDQTEVGRGSFGKVLKASYFGTTVAVKVLHSLVTSDPDYNKFMQREIRILKGMRHPNIVMYIGGCIHQDRHMIVTEYIGGGDLHQVLKTRPQDLTWQTKIKIALDIASAFSYLHSKQIIFRDLKAKNILIEEAGGSIIRAKICDFGFARHLETKQSRNLTLCGTEITMAPEVIVGDTYDETCDIYSYGILLYELICGTRTVKNELKRTPEKSFDLDLDLADSYASSTCPKALLELARICCSYDPKKRPNFKTITMGLTDLSSKPLASLPVKGGQSPRTSNNNNNNKSLNNIKFENTDSVIYNGPSGTINSMTNIGGDGQGTVQYNSVIINHDVETKKFPQEALVDYGGKRNKIMNPSFFSPPSSSTTTSTSSSTTNTSTTTTTSTDSSSNESTTSVVVQPPNNTTIPNNKQEKKLLFADDCSTESGSPPSTLFTSMTISEIRYREPSVFENPDDIIQMKRRFLSSPNLPSLGQQDTTQTSTDSSTATSGLANSWHPTTGNSTPNNNNINNGKKKKGRKQKKKRGQ